MIKKYILFVGLFDKDTKTQKIAPLAARDIIQNIIMSEGLDGATISDATGIYKHDDGSVVIEPSVRVELLFASEKQIKNVCASIKKALNQEAVAVESQTITSVLM